MLCKSQEILDLSSEHDLLQTLEMIISEGDEKGLEYICNTENIDINECLPCGIPPLHYACSLGYLSIVNWLSEFGAELNWTEESIPPPIYLAAEKGHVHIVATLIDFGADANILYEKFDNMGNMVLQSCPLAVAISNGHYSVADFLLEKSIKEICMHSKALWDTFDSYQGTESTPAIHTAIKDKQYYILRRLLNNRRGSSLHYEFESHPDDLTPLGYALLLKDYKALEILLEEGISPNDQLGEIDSYSYYPVEYAIHQEDRQALKILSQFNPDLSLKTEDGPSIGSLLLNFSCAE
ncbi:hypothetical protein JCM16814_34180 [Desulfobaculum senezii]